MTRYHTYRHPNGLLMTAPTDPLLAHLAQPASHHGVIGPAYVSGGPNDDGSDRAPLYLSGCTNPPTVAAAQTQPRLGMLAQPGNSVHLWGKSYSRWAIDNGAFGKAKAGKPWTDENTEEYLAYLATVVRDVDTSNVLFATAPDVLEFVDGMPLGDAEATWLRRRGIFSRIRALGLPVALVAQDGITEDRPFRKQEWDQFDVLFLGGSDAFKLGDEAREITRDAKLNGKWVHMGRVNSLKRLKRARLIGCDSADGTFIGFGPDVNLPKVLRWLDETQPRPRTPLPLALPEAA